jgi:hypothetical protein
MGFDPRRRIRYQRAVSMIHINRDRRNLGQFTSEDVSEGLASGHLLPTDLGWREGMDAWQPLSSFTDLPEISEEHAPPIPPADHTALPEESFPWENRDKIGFFTALTETVFQALGSPAAAFRKLAPTPKMLAPYSFYLLIAVIAFAIYSAECLAIINLAISSLASNPELASRADSAKALTTLKSIGPFWFAFVMLIVVPCRPLVAAGIYHFLLMMFGAARESFLTTFAVTCYVLGAVSPLVVLPCCGQVAMVVWGLIAMSIGLAAAHRTDTWRTTLAVLIPFVFCCGAYFIANVYSALGSMPGSGVHS